MPARHAARRRDACGTPVPAALVRVLIGVLVVSVVGVSGAVALVASGVVASGVVETPGPAPAAAHAADGAVAVPDEEPPQQESVRAERVLAGWDARRARAWRDGDVRALRHLYVPGSRAGARDAAMLRQWSGRGLRVRTLEMSLEQVWVLAAVPGELHLIVRDRVERVVAEADPRSADHVAPASYELPRDAPTVRSLVLRRGPDGWLMARVRPR